MPRGDKSKKYTDQQKRQAEHLEEALLPVPGSS